jgi:hypothetical protein
MKDPRKALERQAAVIDDAETMANLTWVNKVYMIGIVTYSAHPDKMWSPLGIGCGRNGFRGKTVSLPSKIFEGDGTEGGCLGRAKPNKNEKQVAIKETTIAWTCNRMRLPRMIARRDSGLSSSPMFAAVPRRADKFISRFPFRLRITGIIIISSSIRLIAFQCWSDCMKD